MKTFLALADPYGEKFSTCTFLVCLMCLRDYSWKVIARATQISWQKRRSIVVYSNMLQCTASVVVHSNNDVTSAQFVHRDRISAPNRLG